MRGAEGVEDDLLPPDLGMTMKVKVNMSGITGASYLGFGDQKLTTIGLNGRTDSVVKDAHASPLQPSLLVFRRVKGDRRFYPKTSGRIPDSVAVRLIMTKMGMSRIHSAVSGLRSLGFCMKINHAKTVFSSDFTRKNQRIKIFHTEGDLGGEYPVIEYD